MIRKILAHILYIIVVIVLGLIFISKLGIK